MSAASLRHPLARALLALTFSTGVIDAVSYLGLGRVFTANMTGNIAPAELAAISRPWTEPGLALDFREAYLGLVPLLHFAYSAVNPVPIKSLMRAVGLPAGELRRPLRGLEGAALANGLRIVRELELDRKYGWSSAALKAA